VHAPLLVQAAATCWVVFALLSSSEVQRRAAGRPGNRLRLGVVCGFAMPGTRDWWRILSSALLAGIVTYGAETSALFVPAGLLLVAIAASQNLARCGVGPLAVKP
jgi:hypothetical protein